MTSADFFSTSTQNWPARLAISVDVMRELSQYSEPREMFQVFSRRIGQIFPTSRQITLARRGVEPPQVRITRFNLWTEPPDPFSLTKHYPIVEGGLFARLLYADEPQVIDELTIDCDDPAFDYIAGQQSLLAIPIFEQGVAANAVVLTREEPYAFPPEQVPELVWMTNLFGRAMQTLVLSQALQAAYNEAEAEIRAIAELQQSLLPRETPIVPGLECAAHYRTAHRAGGDYFDFFPQPDGSLGVLIADVSGHGTPAAVLMAIAHSIAHAAAAPTARPGAFLTHLNERIARHYNHNSGSFITAFYGVIDPARHRITYASAGHVPPWLIRAEGTISNLNRVQRLPLGINASDEVYPQFEQPFHPGDRVVLVTDGVTEAVNRRGAFFGLERLHELLEWQGRSASETLVRILAAIDRFADGVPQNDDRTVVVLLATN